MKLDREEYKEAVGCLKRYNYNCINIMNIQNDILSLSISPVSDMPRAPYSVGDTTLSKVIKLETDKELQKCVKEYKAVVQAIQLVGQDSKYIFEEEFRKNRYKWDIIKDLNISEETYKRRKRELIYTVHSELNKMKENLQP